MASTARGFSMLREKAFLGRFGGRRWIATIINGTDVAKAIMNEVKGDLDDLKRMGVKPRLCPIIVGNVCESQIYIGRKAKEAEKSGVECDVLAFSSNIPESLLLTKIQELNEDPAVHGIIVQLPLPETFDAVAICDSVATSKDVDGFSAVNLGHLVQGVGLDRNAIVPCTPLAVLKILQSGVGLNFKGKTACVVGRSLNVGMPTSLILSHDGCKGGLDMTTTLCHRNTSLVELVQIVKNSDVVVSATGVPGLITKRMVKPGAVVIDVGINRVQEIDGKWKLKGDVDPDVVDVAGWFSPVPGGVGPCTVACLLRNTIIAAKLRHRPKDN